MVNAVNRMCSCETTYIENYLGVCQLGCSSLFTNCLNCDEKYCFLCDINYYVDSDGKC